MALGMNQMTNTTGEVFRPEIWSKEIIREFEANLVIADKVWRFDQDVVSKGQSVEVPNLSNLVANDKTANTEVVLQSPTETSKVISIDKHKHAAFLVEDILAAQSSYNLLSEYTRKAAYAVKRAVDTDLANLATGFSNNAGTYNTTLTVAAVLTAVQTLDDADVPMNDRCFILKPHAVADMRTLSDYIRYDGTGYAGGHMTGAIGGGETRPNGLVGTLYNAPVYMTSQIAQSGTSISNLYIHKEALALAMQKTPRVQSQYNLELLGDLVVCDTLYGVLETRDEAGLELRN